MHGENKFEFKLFYDLFSFILPPFDSKYLRANIRKVQANPGALHTLHHSRPLSRCHTPDSVVTQYKQTEPHSAYHYLQSAAPLSMTMNTEQLFSLSR